jgi:hypothetical protein
MLKKLLFCAIFLNFFYANAETVKIDVLVIGGTASGLAAALQSARSKVKTIWILPGEWLNNGSSKARTTLIKANGNLPSGIWGEFRQKVRDHYRNTAGFDTTKNAPLRLDFPLALQIFRKMTDSVKNLTVKNETTCTSIKKDGTEWEVTITTAGKTETIKAKVLVDATENGEVIQRAGANFSGFFTGNRNDAAIKTYRTSIASGEGLPGEQQTNNPNNILPYPDYYIPLNAVVAKGADNLLVTERLVPGSGEARYLPLQLTLGQGVGCVAAYCAFFKTTTQHLKVRVIQGELLDFKGYLLPFADVPPTNPAWRAVQQVCATGLLKGYPRHFGETTTLNLVPDTTVNTDEIKPVLLETYTRAFIWFNKEKPGEKFTVGNLLSFISDLTLTDAQVLQTEMQKAWKTQYKFKLDFDLKRPVTRLEFVVLANKFMNPFARTVDLDGRLVN